MMLRAPKVRKHVAGFTLVETLIALLVLSILMVGVFTLINKAQGYYRVEGQKVDLTQQQREFIDQFTRDVHQSGYPTANSLGAANAASAGQGLTSLQATTLTINGDVDGSGSAHSVTYDYNNACGCLRRTLDTGTAYTAVENVVNPGSTGIFTAYDSGGNPMSFPILDLTQVRSVGITFAVQGARESNNRTPIQITMTGTARLPNNDN